MLQSIRATNKEKSLTAVIINIQSFLDNFDSDKGWVTTDATYMAVDTGNSRLKTNWIGGGVNKCIVKNLQDANALNGINASDTTWYLECLIRWSSQSGADNEGMIGLSDKDQTGGKTTLQDFCGLSFLLNYTVRAQNGIYSSNANGAEIPAAGDGTLAAYDWTINTDYIIIVRRYTATLMSAQIWNSAKTVKLADTGNVVISSGIIALQFLKLVNYPAASTTANGWIDTLKFYNGVSEIP